MAKDQEFTAKEIEPFQQLLPEAEHMIDPLSIIGKIVGIKDITTVTVCSSCGKPVQLYQDSTTLGKGQASNCNLIQILNSCEFNWSLRLVIKGSDDSKRNIMLYHSSIQ